MPNQFSWKQVGAALLVYGLVCLAIGMHLAPTKVVKEQVTVEKVDTTKHEQLLVDTDKDRHTNTIKTEIDKPDGTKIIRTRTVEEQKQTRDVKRVTDEKDHTEVTQTTKETTTRGSSPVQISLLAGKDLTNLTGPFALGVQVSKPLLGPIVAGVFGFKSGIAGFSLGLQF
jgi:hypothetical protein